MDKVENKSVATVLREVGDDNQNVRERTLRRLRSLLFRSEAKSAEVEDDSQSAGWTNIQWQNIRVSDVVRLSRDETVPADIVLLYAYGDNGVAYVETMALDGETNLKSKQAFSVFKDCDSISGIQACHAEFVVEDPNPNLYSFEGRVAVGDKVFPLTLNQVIYRGSVLRNTQFAIGLVVNTGEECKVRASKDIPSCQPN
jgi:phospholipid-translocating ATPase